MRKLTTLTFPLILILTFTFQLAQAQGYLPATVSGSIVDSAGHPVPGAVIIMEGATTRKITADAEGKYSFPETAILGFYILSPQLADYDFTPTYRAFSLLANQPNQNFVALKHVPDDANPIDTPEFFVRQQYVDLLHREPDEGGLNYWASQIYACGSNGTCKTTARARLTCTFINSLEYQYQFSGVAPHTPAECP